MLRTTKALPALLLVMLALLACKSSKKDDKPLVEPAEAGASSEPAPLAKPDFELTAESVAKEYAKDAAATDKKYKGKVLRLGGDIARISVYENKNTAYVRLTGAFFKDPHKWMDVTCNTTPTSYAKFLAPLAEKGGALGKKPVGTIQGTYSKVYPSSNEPTIELEPCQLIEPKK